MKSRIINFFLLSADEDYEPLTSYPLLFSPGVSMACVVISIVDEFVVEPDQSFIVSLGSSDPVISTPIAAASVTVEDNDGQFLLANSV